jgi:hypothetical protein
VDGRRPVARIIALDALCQGVYFGRFTISSFHLREIESTPLLYRDGPLRRPGCSGDITPSLASLASRRPCLASHPATTLPPLVSTLVRGSGEVCGGHDQERTGEGVSLRGAISA